MLGSLAPSLASPTDDQNRLVAIYRERFPNVALEEYVHGVYAIDGQLRKQYDAINEFPPYTFDIDEGAHYFKHQNATNTNVFACLNRIKARGVERYPMFDRGGGEVVSLAVSVRRCFEQREQSPRADVDSRVLKIMAYMNFAARGLPRAVSIPETDDELAAYKSGKDYFYTKRGQLDLSCADCHVTAVGKHLRDQTLPPLLGVINHYPVYGLRWGSLGGLHQRFVGCLEQVRAEPPQLHSKEFRELEYFLGLMANGLPLIGPGVTR